MKIKLGNKKGDPVFDPRDEFIRAMLRNFEAADADRDGVVTFSGKLMSKAGNSPVFSNWKCMQIFDKLSEYYLSPNHLI